MDKLNLISLLETALVEADNFTIKYYDGDENYMLDTKKVLNLLKNEIQNTPTQINERVLRAMHDIGVVAVKQYENTLLETAIMNVTSILYKEIPNYKSLKPLRMDFGKGEPI
jgi:type III secretory pathway component EscV